MSITPSISQSAALTALRSFLISLVPSGVEVIHGQDNRVPEPVSSDFITMTPYNRARLATNITEPNDVYFLASSAGTTLTVTQVAYGQILVGQTLFGVGVATGTMISGYQTGTGGVGTYTLSVDQDLASSWLASGQWRVTQPTQVSIQLDVHGPNSADIVQTVVTMFRDDWGVNKFAEVNPGVVPMYTTEPRQMPFVNENQQIENRWVVECYIQINPTLAVPQQFANQLEATFIPVDVVYPA